MTLRLPGLSRYQPETFARWSAFVKLSHGKTRFLTEVIRARLVGYICLFDAVEPRSFEILTRNLCRVVSLDQTRVHK